MLGVRDARRVAWRRQHASRHYVGYVTVTDDTVRLAGQESGTGIDVALSIPHDAIRKVRVTTTPVEEVVGQPSVALDLLDGEPILVRPLRVGDVDLAAFARRLTQT